MENKEKSELQISFTDEQVKEQVNIVLGLGRRTIEDSFRLGEMLTYKKSEKAHGEWLPYLEKIELNERVARNLITAFQRKDKYKIGMNFTQLIGIPKSEFNSDLPKDKSSDWFDQHTESDIEAFTLRNLIKLLQRVEKDFGFVYMNEFTDTIYKVFESGINHTNYKELWKHE